MELDNNPYLETLQIDSNLMTSIDLSQLPILSYFTCSKNSFTHLDVSNNPLLENILFDRNQISSMDLSQNPKLVAIEGNHNELVNFNIKNGNNTQLGYMEAAGNPDLECIQVDNENFANSRTCNYHNWCKDATASYNEICGSVGTEDFFAIDFQLFPNPTDYFLSIQSQTPIENVKIYSIQGILVIEYSTHTFDVSQLSAGVYFVEVNTAGGSATRKFIKM